MLIMCSCRRKVFKWVKKILYLEPEFIKVSAQLENQSLHKGIYTVPVYTSNIAIQGAFDLTRYQTLASG